VDTFYDSLTQPNTREREFLKWFLFILEDQCKSTFAKERMKLIELI
jgi:hypothetical protein